MIKKSILPAKIGFDIDGVVADTMGAFIKVAKNRFGYSLKKEDITTYYLGHCLNIPTGIVDEIIRQLLDDPFGVGLEPIEGAREVLLRLASLGSPLTFVTARPDFRSIEKWLLTILSEIGKNSIRVIATGKHSAKLSVVKELGLNSFLEDHLETCEELFQNGINSIVFDQPWNRASNSLQRVYSWVDFQELIRWE